MQESTTKINRSFKQQFKKEIETQLLSPSAQATPAQPKSLTRVAKNQPTDTPSIQQDICCSVRTAIETEGQVKERKELP